MKLLALIFVIALAVSARAEVLLVNWDESPDEKTGEKRVRFFLSPNWVVEYWKADERGDIKAAIAALKGRKVEEIWSYAILLHGEASRYQKENLRLLEPSPCGGPLELISGSVEVDRKSGVVRVALKVKQEGKLGDFIGNGVYRIPNQPNPESSVSRQRDTELLLNKPGK